MRPLYRCGIRTSKKKYLHSGNGKMTNVMIPNFVEFIEADSVVKIRWEHKEAKLVDSNDREISLLEVLPVLKDKCTRKKLFGETLEEEAKIYQFVEWSLRFGPDLQGDQAATALKELNSFLENRVYLTQHRLTLADVVAFYTVHSLIAKLTYYEKERYVHVSRWYNLIQHTPVKMKLLEVKFSRSKLY
ncbi:eukaryotic translation elongation factor 1 epsilon-1-like isoform X2 [Varroa jacobsoni]|uniref:GST C-terminal domain-containing protein n=1 Tax=Varroa destructor TaxID=109461 RepID=A0A7M7KAK0_VARDE|nr:eukaryotic translation elongation factor 1 epsilon-1-like isoform X1 [Varroa destructor]XP_022697226.1 eukaryotic translation elongation factor 1 epsilon-1-like isoform X2 [Varroa jacobsoni]